MQDWADLPPVLQWILYQVQTSRIPPRFLMVYLHLLSLSAEAPEGEAHCQVSLSGIASGTDLSIPSVSDALADLRQRKWIRVQRFRDPRHDPYEPNRYHILHPPPAWRETPQAMHSALGWFLDLYRFQFTRWSRGSMLVYLALLSLARRNEGTPPCCWPLIPAVSEATGLSEGGVRNAVGALQRQELIEVRPWKVPLRRRQGPNLYFIKAAPPGWQPSSHAFPGLQAHIRHCYTTPANYGLSCSDVTRGQAERLADYTAEELRSDLSRLRRGRRL